MGFNLAQLRAAISPLAFQGNITSAQQTTAINRARQRIYMTNIGGGWKGGDVTVNLAIKTDVAGTSQFVTCPFGVESIVGVYGTDGDYSIQNEWFAFTRASPNASPVPSRGMLRDLGSGFVTFVDIPAAGLKPVFTVTTPAVITLIGLDMNGNDVAETITCPGAGIYTATNTYSVLNSVELTVTVITQLPKIDPGVAGSYWNNGGELSISGIPSPGSPLPIIDPGVNGAFWNDGGVVAISGPPTAGAPLPIVDPLTPGAWYNNGGAVAISAGTPGSFPVITMSDGAGNVYAIYQQTETTVDWRRYQLASGTQDSVLIARCRRSCVPLIYDTDQSDIANIPALEEAVRALSWFDNADYEKADAAMRHAIWYLNGEYARYETEPEIGSAQLDYASSCGGIWNIL